MSMPLASALPIELLHEIFILVRDIRFIDIALVCKRWRDAALPLLWQRVTIDMTNLASRFAEVRETPSSLQLLKRHCSYIQSLSLPLTVPRSSQFIPPDPESIQTDLAIYRRVYQRRRANCNDSRFIQWLFAKHGIRNGWTELRPDSDRICPQLKFIHSHSRLACFQSSNNRHRHPQIYVLWHLPRLTP